MLILSPAFSIRSRRRYKFRLPKEEYREGINFVCLEKNTEKVKIPSAWRRIQRRYKFRPPEKEYREGKNFVSMEKITEKVQIPSAWRRIQER
jgi:hypothetical protein